jgi:hypothetical protein
VRDFGILGRQHDLCVARDVEVPRLGPAVRHRHPPELRVVLAGHGDVGQCLDVAVAAPEDCAVRRERHLIIVGLDERGLMRRGPEPARRAIAEVEECA